MIMWSIERPGQWFCRRGHWLLGCDESVRDAAAYLRIGVPGANCVRFRVEFRA